MSENIKNKFVSLLRWSEKYTGTDMVYLAQGGFWLNTSTVIANIFALVLSIMFARFVSKDVYGTYQFLISIGSIIGGMTLVGMNSAVTQAVARGFDGVFQKSIREQLRFALIPFFIGIIGSFYYLFFGNITLSVSVAVIAILLPISNTFNTWAAFLVGKKDFKHLFIFGQIVNLVYYGGFISIIFIFPSTLPLVIANFLLNVITNILIYLLVVKKYKPQGPTDPEALGYGKKLSLSSLLPMIAINIDNLLIFHFLGSVQLAIYAFASNLPEKLASFLRPISSVAFPKLSAKEPSEISANISKKTFRLFLLALTSGLLYIVFAPFIFKIFFPQYEASVIYSQLYTIAVVISISSSLPVTALYATRSKHIYLINVTYPLYNIGIVCLGAYMFGIWGVIVGKIISNVIFLFQTHYYSKNKL